MAANKVEEGKHALKLVKNASQVSNFCNDVIGDICGIISGAVGSTIIFKLSTKYNLGDSVILGVGVTAFIASFTVGGKALGKSFAMENSEDIIFKVAQVLSFLKRKFNIELFKEKKKLKTDRKE